MKKMRCHNVYKRKLIDLSETPYASKSTEMQALICYISNNTRFIVLYTTPKVSTKEELEKKTDIICIEKGSIALILLHRKILSKH